MKPSVIILTFLLHQAVGDASVDLVTYASNFFANNLYKQVISTGQGNQLVCPLSLHIALTLVHEGAGGTTAQQIAKTIGIDKVHSPNNVDIKQGYKIILANINDGTLKIATKVYPATGYQLNKTYVELARTHFNSDVEEVDYNNSTAAADTINKYVEDKTNNKIHSLIASDSLTSLTRLVLINAVYFQAKWKFPFTSSHDGQFRVFSKQSITTKLMSITEDYLFKEDLVLKAKVLKMDYNVGNYSMIFILPNEETKEALDEVEEKLAGMTVEDVLRNMKEENVEVTIPKFTIEKTLDLKDTLLKMGITDLFESTADLKKMASGNNLYVSKVVQKTFIKVHEEGTEAAAATGFHLTALSALNYQLNSKEFEADRPFHFILIDKKLIIFNGHFLDPSRTIKTK